VSASDGPPLRASVQRSGDTAVVTLVGELDLATADRLRTRLLTVVRSDPAPSRLVLDVSGLHFVDAAGIAVLLTAQRALAAGGGKVVLRSPSRLVTRVVKVLQLQHLLPVER
jgi:anti-anti-sigma factor